MSSDLVHSNGILKEREKKKGIKGMDMLTSANENSQS
jgi:hypothetical protein